MIHAPESVTVCMLLQPSCPAESGGSAMSELKGILVSVCVRVVLCVCGVVCVCVSVCVWCLLISELPIALEHDTEK